MKDQSNINLVLIMFWQLIGRLKMPSQQSADGKGKQQNKAGWVSRY